MMKSVFFLAALAAPLIALAEPGNPGLAEAVRRRLGPNLLARAGIPTSSISKECQSSCSSIVSTLDVRTVFFPLTRWSTLFIFLVLQACNGIASCECSQANFDSLGNCLECLQALGPQFDGTAPADNYGDGKSPRSPSTRPFRPIDVSSLSFHRCMRSVWVHAQRLDIHRVADRNCVHGRPILHFRPGDPNSWRYKSAD